MIAGHSINCENVNQALSAGVRLLQQIGRPEETRAGDCLVAPGPVITVTRSPTQRVLFSRTRDANPFFHLVEAIWMLAGQKTPQPLNRYVADFGSRFAEAGGEVHGAYGFRWRHHFGLDQLEAVVQRLRRDPGTRQCVIQMWDCTSMFMDVNYGDGNVQSEEQGAVDLIGDWKDRPCNTHAYVRIRGLSPILDHVEQSVLDLTVCCRSNDIVWGAHGANAVHFSVLQEYLAARVGCEVGTLYQLSNNYHVYVDFLRTLESRAAEEEDGIPLVDALADDRYFHGVRPAKMFISPDEIDADCRNFMDWHEREILTCTAPHFENPWFKVVACPAARAHRLFRAKKKAEALTEAAQVMAEDWRLACCEWIARRI